MSLSILTASGLRDHSDDRRVDYWQYQSGRVLAEVPAGITRLRAL